MAGIPTDESVEVSILKISPPRKMARVPGLRSRRASCKDWASSRHYLPLRWSRNCRFLAAILSNLQWTASHPEEGVVSYD